MTWNEEKLRLAETVVKLLYENRMIRTSYRDKAQGWILVSGIYSPLYIQLRPLVSYPSVFKEICRAMVRMVGEEAPDVTKVVGIAMAGVPVAAGMSVLGNLPAAFTRKMEGVKSIEALRDVIASYGEHSMLEGELSPGDELALVDDLVTRFDSKLIALEQVRHEIRKRNLNSVGCKTVVVALDREQGGQEAAHRSGLKLLSLVPFKTVGLPILKSVMAEKEWEIISTYLDNTEIFQDPKVQEEVARSSIAS